LKEGTQNKRRMPSLSGQALASLFIAAALLPILAALASGVEAASVWSELGTGFGLTAAALMFLQFLSSGRFESVSGQVGIDRTMGFHRLAAYVLVFFAVLHPLIYLAPTLYADPTAAWHRLTGMLASNRLRSGVVAIVGLLVLVAFASIRTRSFVRYEYWRASHSLLAIAVAGLALHHAMTAGTYSNELPLALVWLLFAAMSVGAISVVYFVRPRRMWRGDWRVERLHRLSPHVVEMLLHGRSTTNLQFRGGQFMWITLAPNRPPFHDHPFSIASGPADLPNLRLVIREVGDCTNSFASVEPGTRVAVDGPHGSFILPDGRGPVLMIAGGVGIAPLLGMLEQAAAEGDKRTFRLLYSARTPSALAGLERLRELQSHLDFSLTCLVDEASEGTGFLPGPPSERQIRDLLKGLAPEHVTALICGPARMMELVADALLNSGVLPHSIGYERFDYAAGRGRLDKKRRRECLAVLLVLVAAVTAFGLR
jgi:predicted ferric reductase